MWKDPIVEEIRKIREEHAKKFNYDLDAIVKDLKKHERESMRKGRKFVSFSDIDTKSPKSKKTKKRRKSKK